MAAKKSNSKSSGALRKVFLAVLIIGLAYVLKGWFIAAVVNGDPISRLSVVRELEKEQGKAALDWLITKKLIFQEARKRKIVVSNKELEEEMVRMERALVPQGQSFEQALAVQGLTRDSFKERIKITKIIEKIFDKEVVVTDKEVEDFLAKNQEALPENSDPEKLKSSVRNQLKSQKVDQKGNDLIQKLKKEAKVLQFVNY